MPETPTSAVVPVPPGVLLLAVRCALAQRTHDDDQAAVALAVYDHVDHLPADILRELDNRITYWLDGQLIDEPPPALWRWSMVLTAVRQAREETPR